MPPRYRRYPIGVKQHAVERIQSGESVGAVARELGVDRTTLYRWRLKAIQTTGADATADAACVGRQQHIQELEAEIARLEAALRRKELESDFLANALRRVAEIRKQKSLSAGKTSARRICCTAEAQGKLSILRMRTEPRWLRPALRTAETKCNAMQRDATFNWKMYEVDTCPQHGSPPHAVDPVAGPRPRRRAIKCNAMQRQLEDLRAVAWHPAAGSLYLPSAPVRQNATRCDINWRIRGTKPAIHRLLQPAPRCLSAAGAARFPSAPARQNATRCDINWRIRGAHPAIHRPGNPPHAAYPPPGPPSFPSAPVRQNATRCDSKLENPRSEASHPPARQSAPRCLSAAGAAQRPIRSGATKCDAMRHKLKIPAERTQPSTGSRNPPHAADPPPGPPSFPPAPVRQNATRCDMNWRIPAERTQPSTGSRNPPHAAGAAHQPTPGRRTLHAGLTKVDAPSQRPPAIGYNRNVHSERNCVPSYFFSSFYPYPNDAHPRKRRGNPRRRAGRH